MGSSVDGEKYRLTTTRDCAKHGDANFFTKIFPVTNETSKEMSLGDTWEDSVDWCEPLHCVQEKNLRLRCLDRKKEARDFADLLRKSFEIVRVTGELPKSIRCCKRHSN